MSKTRKCKTCGDEKLLIQFSASNQECRTCYNARLRERTKKAAGNFSKMELWPVPEIKIVPRGT